MTRILITFFLLCTPLLVHAASCEKGDVVSVYQFDPANISYGLRGIEAYDEHSVTVVDDPLAEKQSVLKFTVKAGQIVQNGNRAEIKISDYFSGDYTFHYRFQFMLPADYVSDGRWQSLAQWHDQPDTSVGQTWADYPASSPPLALLFENDSVYIHLSPERRKMHYSNPVKIERDRWNKVEFIVNWSLGENGSVLAYVNDELLVPENSDLDGYTGPNLFNRAGNYFKFGLYRGRDAVAENNLYFSDIQIVARCNS